MHRTSRMTSITRALLGAACIAACITGAFAATAQESQPAAAPPADPAMKRLNESPRHHEWVEVKHGERTVHCFLVYPEVEEAATAVLVIHENKGLTDWVRSVADQLAEAGYIAIAPDLLSGMGSEGGRTDSFESVDAATQALYKVDAAQVTADLNAVADFVLKLPASSDSLVVGGFCWGGSQTFNFAGQRDDLKAAFVFYGTGPKEKEAMAGIDCPVYGFYGGNDNRVNSTIDATVAAMKELGKTYEPVLYPGAGHGFMRAGEAENASDANKRAMREAWARWKKLLAEM